MKKLAVIKPIAAILIALFLLLGISIYYLDVNTRAKTLTQSEATSDVNTIFSRIKYEDTSGFVVSYGLRGGGRDRWDYYLVRTPRVKLDLLKEYLFSLHDKWNLPSTRKWKVDSTTRRYRFSVDPEWWPKDSQGLDIIKIQSVHVSGSSGPSFGYSFLFSSKNGILYIFHWTT